jgi:Glycosyltransferase
MKLLVVLSRFPYPLEKGDKLRAYNQLKLLSKHHEIYLVALNERKLQQSDIEKVKPFCKELHIVNLHWWTRLFHISTFFFKGLPLQCGYFYNNKAQKKIRHLIHRIKPDHIYGQLIRVAEYIKKSPIQKTLDYQDVLSKGIARRAEVAPWYLKPFLMTEYKRVARYEAEVFSYFDHHTIITGVDRDLIPHPNFNKIYVIANGVDFETYSNKTAEKEYDLIFTGNMSYVPNVEAAEYLAKTIFPLLQQEIPNLKLAICGANPSPKVKQLATENIFVTGWVDSIADYYAKSKVFVAPMQLGTGLQNKLLEAMAMKLPCVTSTLAGKPLDNVETGKEIMICSTTTGYVESIKALLTNPALYQEVSENGHEFVKRNYSWEKTVQKLDEIMGLAR